MAAYAAEEAASEQASAAMRARIEARKREIAEKKAAKEAEEMAMYMAEEVLIPRRCSSSCAFFSSLGLAAGLYLQDPPLESGLP